MLNALVFIVQNIMYLFIRYIINKIIYKFSIFCVSYLCITYVKFQWIHHPIFILDSEQSEIVDFIILMSWSNCYTYIIYGRPLNNETNRSKLYQLVNYIIENNRIIFHLLFIYFIEKVEKWLLEILVNTSFPKNRFYIGTRIL